MKCILIYIQRAKKIEIETLIITIIIKEIYWQQVFKKSFFSENPIELCNRLYLLIQEKQAGNDTKKFDNEIVAIFDNLLEYKSITPKQHKQISININLLHTRKRRKTS